MNTDKEMTDQESYDYQANLIERVKSGQGDAIDRRVLTLQGYDVNNL